MITCDHQQHSRIQKVVAKYIKYLCAENSKTMAQWIASIRAVKVFNIDINSL